MANTITKKQLGAVSQPGTGLMIDKVWYNLQDKDAQCPEPLKKGWTVTFEYEDREVNGRPSKIITSKVSIDSKQQKQYNSGGQGKGNWNGNKKEDPSKQLSIVRQNALTNATAIIVAKMKHQDIPVDKACSEVLKLADKLSQFADVKGDSKSEDKPKQQSFGDPQGSPSSQYSDPETGSDETVEDEVPF